MPYFIDGDLKFTESRTIIEYVALKYRPELLGETIRDKVMISQLAGVIYDVKVYMAANCYSDDFLSRKDQVVNGVREELRKTARYLGDKQFINGDKICYVDFMLLETLEMLEALGPGSLAQISDKFVEYRDRMRSLPNVCEYVSKPRLPFNNTRAKWRDS